jgi:hypothetical protein
MNEPEKQLGPVMTLVFVVFHGIGSFCVADILVELLFKLVD